MKAERHSLIFSRDPDRVERRQFISIRVVQAQTHLLFFFLVPSQKESRRGALELTGSGTELFLNLIER